MRDLRSPSPAAYVNRWALYQRVGDLSKQSQVIPPWLKGPFELILHANEHLQLAGDTDRRISLIGFDNAIETCIDLFLSLHPKVRGDSGITSEDREKAGRNYHTKLEFFYGYMATKGLSVEIPIEDVIWYHQLRNQLYHSGHGVTPDAHTLFGARAAALLVFKSLFKADVSSLIGNQVRPKRIDEHDLGNWLGVTLGDLREASRLPAREAQTVRDILRAQGHVLLMRAEHNQNRFYRACEVPDIGFGIQVVEWYPIEMEWHVITSFIKRSSPNLQKLQTYLERTGAVVYSGDLPKPILV